VKRLENWIERFNTEGKACCSCSSSADRRPSRLSSRQRSEDRRGDIGLSTGAFYTNVMPRPMR